MTQLLLTPVSVEDQLPATMITTNTFGQIYQMIPMQILMRVQINM